MKKRILATLAYVLPTFPLGYIWHLSLFAEYYKTLGVYRQTVLIPLGIASMLIQGIVWSVVYERLFAGLSVGKGAIRFFSLAFPLAWSFAVLAVSAKHLMNSVSGYFVIETAFTIIHFAIVSPLLATVYANKKNENSARV